MDGNSLISQDKSGNGGGIWVYTNKLWDSNSVDKATLALPILEGAGGAVANVRTDANASNLVLALPLVGSNRDVSNQINSGSTTKSHDHGVVHLQIHWILIFMVEVLFLMVVMIS